MTENKSNTGIKAAVIVLALALVGAVVFAYVQYDKNKKTTEDLTSKQEQLIDELEIVRGDYDKAIEENDSTNQELVDARNRISLYIDSLKSKKADIAVLWKYKGQVDVLKKERAYLLRLNDSLRSSNMIITMERDSTKSALKDQIVFNDSIVVQNTQLAKVVEIGAALNLSKLSVDAVKVRNSGKMVSTQKARRVDKLKVCFTVAPNNIAAVEDKTFYIQITGPKGKILGQNAAMSTETASINYSIASTFYFESSTLDVCEYLDKPANDFEEGTYKVIIFDKKLKNLGTTTFTMD